MLKLKDKGKLFKGREQALREFKTLVRHKIQMTNKGSIRSIIKAATVLFSFIVLLTSSCATKMNYDDFSDFSLDTIILSGDEKYLNESSDYIFNQKTLHTFELNIPLKDLKQIDSDPVAELYVAAKLKFNGETISPVGIRYKGSIGAFVGAVSGNDWGNPTGYKTATKISMKIKIDWIDSTKTFYGLKKLQFHSQNLDPSQMHERLGYWLYREMGVVAPRSVHARLVINGVYHGVYALTEQIDEQFIAHNFKDGSGNLYKEVWPLNYLGQAQEESHFLDHLKTNKKTKLCPTIIKTFADSIVKANNTELRQLIINRMNLNQILAYAMIDQMIRNDDGAFHWYCLNEVCDNHNYYWYEEPTTQKLHLIPWDLDIAFENIGYGKRAVTRVHNVWGETSNNCEPFPSYAKGFNQKSAACDKLTSGWVSFKQEYDSLKTVFNRGPFSEELVYKKVDEWSEQIRVATKHASEIHKDAINEEDWNKALNNLKGELRHSRLDY